MQLLVSTIAALRRRLLLAGEPMRVKERLNWRAQGYLLKGDFDKSLELYRLAYEVDPQDPLIQRTLADIYIKRGEIETGIEFLVSAARLCLESNEPMRGIALLHRVWMLELEHTGRSRTDLLEFAEALIVKRSYAEAMALLRPLVRRLLSGDAAEESEAESALISVCEGLAAADPENVEALVSVAALRRRAGDLKRYRDCRLAAALVLTRRKEDERALGLLLPLTEMAPADIEVASLVTEIELRLGRTLDALRSLERFVEASVGKARDKSTFSQVRSLLFKLLEAQGSASLPDANIGQLFRLLAAEGGAESLLELVREIMVRRLPVEKEELLALARLAHEQAPERPAALEVMAQLLESLTMADRQSRDELCSVYSRLFYLYLALGERGKAMSVGRRLFELGHSDETFDRDYQNLMRPEEQELEPARHEQSPEELLSSAALLEKYGYSEAAERLRRKALGTASRADFEAALTGNLQAFGLLDIIQLIDLSKQSGTLRITSGEKTGEILFNQGQIADAAVGPDRPETGIDAVFSLIRISEGKYDFIPSEVPPERMLDISTTSILLEGLRLLDEERAAREERGQEPGARSQEKSRKG